MEINCLVKVNEINYKIVLRPDDNRIFANQEDLRIALSNDEEPDFKKYDFNAAHFVFEIYDKSMNEYVSIDAETDIENMSKIRVKILDPDAIAIPDFDEMISTPFNEEELSFLDLSDFKEDVELVELYAQSHVPDDEIIKMVDNSVISPESFSVPNIRVKKQLVKSVIKFQNCFHTLGTFHDAIWDDIVNDIRENIGLKVISLIRNRREELGFVRITPMLVQKELITLIGQYNRLLRMCKCLTAQQAERLWPLFKIFHRALRIEYIYPEKGPSLMEMRKDFDNAKKMDSEKL